MASSLLDELPCLLDESDELIARLSFHLKLLFSPPPTNRAHSADRDQDPYVLRQELASLDVEALARFFGKHILMAPSATSALSERLDAILPPQESASFQALRTLAAKIFHLMKRVYQWQQATWDETLLPFFVANSSHLTFDRHRLLTSLVLTGITKSVKLHLLWSSYPHLAGILMLHSYLDSKKKLAEGANVAICEQDAYRPLDFVLYFGSNPLIKIQQELQQHALAHKVAHNMLELVLSCFDCYVGCYDLAHLKNGGQVFEIDASVIQGSYASSHIFQDLLVLPQLVEWVLCVALCLPHQWKSEPIRNSSWQLWDFVQLISQDRLVLVVARDLCVNLHDLLFQQLTSALSSTTNVPSASGASLKKSLSRLSKQTVQCGGERRRERRVLVEWVLRDCVKLLRHNGGLAAPLLPRLFAVMALAQDELEWMLAHQCATKLLPTHVKSKYMERATQSYKINPAELTELLGLYNELRDLLATEGDYIRRYYTQFIARGDADAIAKEINRFLNENEDASATPDSRVVALLQSFSDRRRFQLAATDPGFASWRREWQQLSVYLLVTTEAPGGSPVPATISGLLERACRHANYVQAYDHLLQRIGSVSKCFWFQDALDYCAREHTKKVDTKAGNCVIIPFVLNELAAGRATVEELLELNEANHEVARLRHRVELHKLAIGDHIQRAIIEFLMEEEKLHARLSPLQMIERMGKRSFQHGVSSSAKTSEKAATAMLLLTPGTESRLLTTPDAAVQTAQALAGARVRLTAIVSCLDLYVGDTEGDPLALYELVSTSLRACVAHFLRGLVTERERHSGDVKKYSLRVPWEDAARQWRALQRCVLHQFRSTKWGSVQRLIESTLADECAVGAHGADRSRLMDRVLAFYGVMLESKCVARGRPQAELLASFAPTPNYLLHRSHSSSEADPSSYASPPALAFLEDIVGRASMRALRGFVVEHVRTHTKKLFESLEKDKIALIRLKLAFPEDQSEIHMAVRIMEALDTGIVHELLSVGNGVFFLQILDAARPATMTAPESTRQPLGAEEDSKETLRRALRALWTTCPERREAVGEDELPSHVQTIWNLLPWAVVAAFYGTLWSKTKHLRGADATTTNTHLLAPAVALLVETFKPRSAAAKDAGTVESARHTAYVASQAVLSLRRVSSELPTPAMVAMTRELLRRLAAMVPDGEVQDWLPDCIQEMTALAA